MSRGRLLRMVAAGYLLLVTRCCTGQNSWTPDRDDAQNLQLTKDLNTYLPPATQQYPTSSLSDEPPFAISWHMGQNIHDAALGPVQGELFFKNGAACWLAEDEIVVTGGLWYAPRLPQGAPFNSTYLYRPSNDSWTKLAPAPFLASRTSGACDPKAHTLYLVSGLEGKCAGGKGCVAALSRANAGGTDGAYSWRFLPGIPDGTRYLGASGFLAAADGSQWLVTATGMASGVPPVGAAVSIEPRRQSEPASVWAVNTTKLEGRRTGAELPGYRLKLGGANASLLWEVTAPFPGGGSNSDHGCLIPQTANLNGSMYLFGGMAQVVSNATTVWDDMVHKYALPITDTSAGCAVFYTSWRYDVLADKWSALPSPPFPVVAGGTVVLRNRFIVLLGSEQRTTFRVGNTSRGTLPAALPFWSGYGDQVLCFDTHTSMWSRIGLMPYGLGTLQTVTNGSHIYTFGGEPTTHHNANTENAVQIGVITMMKTDDFPASGFDLRGPEFERKIGKRAVVLGSATVAARLTGIPAPGAPGTLTAPEDGGAPYKCSCKDPQMCHSLTPRDAPASRKEVMAFHSVGVYGDSGREWEHWDWGKVTSVAIFVPLTEPDMADLLCAAHAHNVRVLGWYGCGGSQQVRVGNETVQLNPYNDPWMMLNATLMADWVNSTVECVMAKGLDGIALDVESLPWPPLSQHNRSATDAVRSGFTDMICALKTRLEMFVPGALVVHVPNQDARAIEAGIDFGALNQCVDLFVPMAYQSCYNLRNLPGFSGQCDYTKDTYTAGPRALATIDAIKGYMDVFHHRYGIAYAKLAPMPAWFGVDFLCSPPADPRTKGQTLVGKHNCTTAQRLMPTVDEDLTLPNPGYGHSMQMAAGEAGGRAGPVSYDNETGHGWFDFFPTREINSTQLTPSGILTDAPGERHQVWFESPRSLKLKYDFFVSAGYGGLGVWTAGAVGSVSDYYFCAKASTTATLCCGCAAICSEESCPAATKAARGGLCPPCAEASVAKTAQYAAQLWASVPQLNRVPPRLSTRTGGATATECSTLIKTDLSCFWPLSNKTLVGICSKNPNDRLCTTHCTEVAHVPAKSPDDCCRLCNQPAWRARSVNGYAYNHAQQLCYLVAPGHMHQRAHLVNCSKAGGLHCTNDTSGFIAQ